MNRFQKSILAIIALFIISGVNGQTVQWAHSGSSPGYEYGNAITTDDSGNVYISGQIEYTTHFDNGQSLSSAGIHDIFAAKYGPDGTVKWLRSAGGNGGDVGYGVTVDPMHNYYATGEVEHTAYFSSTDSVISKGGNDIFVSKYDMNGQLQWAKSFGSTESDKGYSMIANSNGDVFVTGFYSAHIYFDNIHLTPVGVEDVYTMKLNANGDVQWAKKGAGSDDDRGKGITYDRFGNIYVAGFFTDQATFSGTTITNSGTTGGFLVKYDSTGQKVWVKGNCCGTTEYDGIAIDENGFIYTTGFFEGTVTIGNTTLTSTGNTDILIVKYDENGDVIWAKKAGGPYEDVANGITVDSINHLFYITGQLDDHGNFDSLYAGAAGNRDVFIAAYDYNGDCQWVKPYGGVHRDIGYAVANDRDGNVFTTGVYTNIATFGNYTLTPDLLNDYYVEKVSPPAASAPLTQAANLIVSLSNCNDLQLNFTPGSGAGRIIIAHENGPVNIFPVDGNAYQANSLFGAGDSLGSDNFVIYNGTGDSVTVTGLTTGVNYYFAVFEYNGIGAMTGYLLNNPPRAFNVAGTYSVSIQASTDTICEGDTLTLTATGGGTYNWLPSSGLSSTTDSVVNAFPISTTIYTVTADTNGCQVQNTISVSVNMLPVVAFSLSNSFCLNSSPVTLTGGSPTGGVYNGIGVASGMFDPSVNGVGSEDISYTYVDSNSCTNSVTSSTTILPLPSVSIGNDTTICADDAITLNAGSASTYSWSTGSILSSVLIDSSGTGLGTADIFVVIGDSSGCTNADTIQITFSVCTGISTTNENPALIIYPNPFNQTLHLHLDENADVSVYDLTGKLVENLRMMNGDVEFGESLSAGLYSIIVLQRNSRTVFHVVKGSDF